MHYGLEFEVSGLIFDWHRLELRREGISWAHILSMAMVFHSMIIRALNYLGSVVYMCAVEQGEHGVFSNMGAVQAASARGT